MSPDSNKSQLTKIRLPWRVRRMLRWAWSTDTVLVFRMGAREGASVPHRPSRTDAAFSSASVQDMSTGSRELPAGLCRLLHDVGPGAIVHIAEVGGVIASWGVSALATRWHITETDTWLDLPDRAACLMGFETQPEHRGRGIYKSLLREILWTRFADGERWAYIWCEKSNHASRAAIERVGFQLIGCHFRTRVLGWSRRAGGPSP